MKKANETVVLCGASAYEEKYYLNPQFSKLPEHIRQGFPDIDRGFHFLAVHRAMDDFSH